MFKQIKIIFKQITSTWIHPRFLSYIELIFQDYTNYPKANTSGLLTAFLEAYLEKNYSGILQNIFFIPYDPFIRILQTSFHVEAGIWVLES
jgi:hypothetical protein